MGHGIIKKKNGDIIINEKGVVWLLNKFSEEQGEDVVTFFRMALRGSFGKNVIVSKSKFKIKHQDHDCKRLECVRTHKDIFISLPKKIHLKENFREGLMKRLDRIDACDPKMYTNVFMGFLEKALRTRKKT